MISLHRARRRLNTLLIMTKRVVVQMSDDCHKALKQYAAFYDMTMSEVSYNDFLLVCV